MAVTFDAVGPSSSGHGGASSPVTWTHTGSASATALLVGVSVDAANDTGCTASVTFKGNAMTQVGANIHSDNLTSGFIAVFGIAGTNAAGTGTVSVSVSGGTGVDQIAGGSLSFLGSATTVAAAFGTPHSAFGSSGVQSVSAPSTVSGNVIGSFVCSGSAIGTATSPSTSRYVFASATGNQNAAFTGGATTPSTGSAVTCARANNGDTWSVLAVEVQAAGSPVISTTSLLSAAESQYYYEDLHAAGGATPYTWSVSSGSLPSWASLNTSTGVITGTAPATSGSTTFTVQVTDAVSSTGTQSLTLNVVPRDPVQQPFDSTTSPWNVPIGSGATYVSVSLPSYPYSPSNFTTMPNIDDERIVLAPTAPVVTIAYSSAGWSGTNRCAATGGSVGGLPITVPVPATYTCPNDNQNDAAAFLQADGRTISQCQPLALCTAGGNGTSIIAFADVDLYGSGITGSQGGSGLSAYGGAIRLGELRPGQTGMRHAIKIVVDSNYVLAPQTSLANSFRWPAVTADSDWSSYGSTNGSQYSGMKMGALLAIPASVNLTTLGLLGEPGRQLAWTLQNYGAYIVDSGGTGFGWALCAEGGAQGSMRDQFLADWGIPFFDRVNSNTSWTNDVQTCMLALQLVDNNSATSIGGGGTPLQPLAPPIFPPGSVAAGLASATATAKTPLVTVSASLTAGLASATAAAKTALAAVSFVAGRAAGTGTAQAASATGASHTDAAAGAATASGSALAARIVRGPQNYGTVLTGVAGPDGAVVPAPYNATLASVNFGASLAAGVNYGAALTNAAGPDAAVVALTCDAAMTFAASFGATLTGGDMQGPISLSLSEFNDMTFSITVTANGSPYNLTGATLNMLLKSAAGSPDSGALVLSSAGGSPAITIAGGTGGTATVVIPKADLSAETYGFYRLDVVSGGLTSTTVFGPIAWVSL